MRRISFTAAFGTCLAPIGVGAINEQACPLLASAPILVTFRIAKRHGAIFREAVDEGIWPSSPALVALAIASTAFATTYLLL